MLNSDKFSKIISNCFKVIYRCIKKYKSKIYFFSINSKIRTIKSVIKFDN